MIKQVELTLLPKQAFDKELIKKIASSLSKVNSEEIKAVVPVRRSIDARGSKPRFKLLVNVFVNESPEPKEKIIYRHVDNNKKVIIVGAGPGGLFAALKLIQLGFKPVIFERGKDVQSRRRDLRDIQQNSIVNPDSNYCFGEGGAGTYSDGKLYTRSTKRGNVKNILNLFVQHGADEDILIDAHPHIGSNKLPKVVQAIRETILQYGGEIHF
ncbi:MAG: FAD-binding protein, partial [Ignavibacteriales bacterium]